MNKKKLIIFMLVVIMVLSLCVTTLLGCDKNKDKDKDPVKSGNETPSGSEIVAPDGYHVAGEDVDVASILNTTLENAIKQNGLDNLKFSTELAVNTKYGTTENKYLIKLGANLAFDVNDKNTNVFSLQILDVAANANVLAVYYREDPNSVADITNNQDDPANIGKGNVYVALGSGNTAKYFNVNALGIKSVLRTQWIPGDKDESGNLLPDEPEYKHPSIDSDGADKLGNDVIDGLAKVTNIIDIVSGVCNVFESEDLDSYIIRIDLAKLLTDLDSMINMVAEGFNTIISNIGLDLAIQDLGKILPALSADLTFNMSNVNKSASFPQENAVFDGLDINLNVTEKDFRVKKLNGDDFIRINIAKEFDADVKFDFAYGSNANVPTNLVVGKLADYGSAINAINFTAAGELKLNKEISMAFSMSGEEKTIVIPAGDYAINLAADIDPTALIGMEFNASGTTEIINLVVKILQEVVKKLHIEIVDKADADNILLLDLTAGEEDLTLTIDPTLLQGTLMDDGEGGGLKSTLAMFKNGRDLSAIIDLLPSLFPSTTADSETSSGDDNAALFATIKGIIDNMSIVANAGNLTVTLNNQVVADNSKTEFENTILNATVIANKTAGMTVEAALKNIVIGKECADISANITANSSGVTILAKTTKGTILGSEIDVELKLTEFNYGAANK